MRRDLAALADNEFDLVIVGGGIFGACAAREAALRGYSVALLERHDFASGVSANSFKMVHGGIRYLQHADLIRLQTSCQERAAFLRIAPHLVRPLPIVIPTYGRGRTGKAFLGAGMLLYDFLTLGRNRGISDPDQRVPWTQFLGRHEILNLFPDLNRRGLSGGAVFRDAQMYNPTRLVLAFIQSAEKAGAVVANYAEAIGLLRHGDSVQGVIAEDKLGRNSFPVRARTVLNAAGPWAEYFLRETGAYVSKGTYSRDVAFVVPKRLPHGFALAALGSTRDPDAILSRPARHLFVVPWRQYSLVGVWHSVVDNHPDRTSVGEDEMAAFLHEINTAVPSLDLSLDDLLTTNSGLVPFGENSPGAVHLSYGKRSILIDHEASGVRGLVSLIGVRYTMARREASSALDLIDRKQGRAKSTLDSSRVAVEGGEAQDLEALVRGIRDAHPRLPAAAARALAHNHGSGFARILRYGDEDSSLVEPLPESTVLGAEVVHAVRHEMAATLGDIVLRRTDLATAGHPGTAALTRCAAIAGRELGWSPARTAEELHLVEAALWRKRSMSAVTHPNDRPSTLSSRL